MFYSQVWIVFSGFLFSVLPLFFFRFRFRFRFVWFSPVSSLQFLLGKKGQLARVSHPSIGISLSFFLFPFFFFFLFVFFSFFFPASFRFGSQLIGTRSSRNSRFEILESFFFFYFFIFFYFYFFCTGFEH